MQNFTTTTISLAGAPPVEWRFHGAVGEAECAGAHAIAVAIDDAQADLKIRDAIGLVIADVRVRKMPADESITVSAMGVGSALLWSHARWAEAEARERARPITAADHAPLNLQVVVFREDGMFVAVALEVHIAAQGASAFEAVAELGTALDASDLARAEVEAECRADGTTLAPIPPAPADIVAQWELGDDLGAVKLGASRTARVRIYA